MNFFSDLIDVLYFFLLLTDGKPQDYQHRLFSRAQRIQARVTREVVHSTVRGSQRHQHREKREIPLSSTIHPVSLPPKKTSRITSKLKLKPHLLFKKTTNSNTYNYDDGKNKYKKYKLVSSVGIVS